MASAISVASAIFVQETMLRGWQRSAELEPSVLAGNRVGTGAWVI